MTKKKERLDKVLVARGLVATRAKARGLIMAGEVWVDGVRVDKAGTAVFPQADIQLKNNMPYVSRGGYKLAGALTQFDIQVTNLICADVGACTGGFTDVLLQQGAAHVYTIDVGYGQLDWKLRQDKRVTVLERTNARYLTTLPQPIDFVCIDVSFISLKLILPTVQQWLAPQAQIVALIKPQFEAGRKQVGKGGVVRSAPVRQEVLADLLQWTRIHDLTPMGLIRSPIEGTNGNIEYLIWLKPGEKGGITETAISLETLCT